MQRHSLRHIFVAAGLSCLWVCASPAWADPVSDFYRGNTIRLHVSASAGGTYDLVARLFVKYFANQIPGHPTVVIVNVPGAMTATIWAYNVGAKDGTAIAMPLADVAMSQMMYPQQARYDVSKFNWIGNLEDSTGSLFTYHKSPTKTIYDAMKRETVMGVPARSGLSYQYLALSNALLKTRFKIISGYERNRIIAMESGELEGSATALQNYAGLMPGWDPGKMLNILALFSRDRLPQMPNVPTMAELTSDPAHKKILEFMMLQSATSRSILAPPGAPAERVDALRQAFDRTARDPEFVAEMRKHQLEVSPSSGAETHKAVSALIATAPEVIAMALEAVK